MACPISSSKCSCHLSGDSTTPSRVINKPAMTFLMLNTPLMLISSRDISYVYIWTRNGWNFADSSVDEVCPHPLCDQPSENNGKGTFQQRAGNLRAVSCPNVHK